MKQYTMLAVLAFASVSALAQFTDKFGLISPEEASLKQCSFDTEASAVVLLDEAYSDYTDDNGLLTYFHKRIKILKDDGVKHGDITLSYYSDNDFEILDNIQAVSINIAEDGVRRDLPVGQKSIYVKKATKYRTEVSFAFPDVKAGTILEYKYRVNAKHYGGLRDWYFQDDIPVIHSSYRLKIVPGHEVSYLVQYNPRFKVSVNQIGSDNAVKFEMKNIPALTDEPYMDAREDYVQKVIFQTTKYAGYGGSTTNYMSSWKEVCRDLNDRSDFGRQMRIKIDECQEFITLGLNGKSDLEKMQAVHHYVANNLTWDGYYGLTAANGIKSLWKKKSGNSAEINLLLINLLRQAGLDAQPMLVSERGHGRVNKEQPFISQFNNVFAVVNVNNKQYYIDATDKFTPSTLTPYSVLNSTGFIVDNRSGTLIDIKETDVRYTENIAISATLSEDGKLSGSANLESKDYARSEKLANYINHKSEYVDSYIKANLVNVDVNNFNIKNAEEEGLPFTQFFDFKTNVQSNGDYAFLDLNMFTGLQNNPFIVNERFSNVNFGYKKTINLTYVVNMAPNFKVDALPKNIRLVNSDNTVELTRQFFLQGNQLMAKIKVNIDKTIFNVNEYPAVKDFFKQMVNLMNEQVVLKTK